MTDDVSIPTLLRLPLELRLHIFRLALPIHLTISPCLPPLTYPPFDRTRPSTSPSTSITTTTNTPPSLPQPCSTILPAAHSPLLPTDPCLSLHLTCRAMHLELSRHVHDHSAAHGLRLVFCSPTCLAAYVAVAPDCVVRRLSVVEVGMRLTGWVLQGGSGKTAGALGVVKGYVLKLVGKMRGTMGKGLGVSVRVEEPGMEEQRRMCLKGAWRMGDDQEREESFGGFKRGDQNTVQVVLTLTVEKLRWQVWQKPGQSEKCSTDQSGMSDNDLLWEL